MIDYTLYEKPVFVDSFFPIRISHEHFRKLDSRQMFKKQWHEQIELLYFTSGLAIIQINSDNYSVQPGDLLVINSNELHMAEFLSDHVSCFSIIIDTSIFHDSFLEFHCARQITRNSNYSSLLMNKVSGDRYIHKCFNLIQKEQSKKDPGYELAVKSAILRLIAILIRKYTYRILSKQKYDTKIRNLEKLNKAIQYIEEMYKEDICIDTVCRLVNFSPYYFCRIFKSITGKTLSEYVNQIRVDKAELLVINTNMNMNEIAMDCGFNDPNYFSRCFKKYKKVSPSRLRKSVLSCD